VLLLLFFAQVLCAQTQSATTTFKDSDRDAFLAAKDFTTYRSVTKIPASVSKALAELFRDPSWEMADPDKPYQSTDVIMDPTLPVRRLVFVATSKDYCAVHYERGGIARSDFVLIFRMEGDSAHLVWGGYSRGQFADVDALKSAIKSKQVTAGTSGN